MSTLNVEIAEADGAVVVRVVGEGSAANARALETSVTRLCAMRPRLVVLDLSQLSFIASLCMGCFVALRRGITAHGGTVRIAGATPEVALALRRAKLDVILPLDVDVASSVAVGAAG